MSAPTEGNDTTATSVRINWLPLTTLKQTGGTNTILSYELQVYGPSNNWTSLIGGDQNLNTQLTFLHQGLTTGVNYKYRVRASNLYGWGPYSNEATIRPDDAPA